MDDFPIKMDDLTSGLFPGGNLSMTHLFPEETFPGGKKCMAIAYTFGDR